MLIRRTQSNAGTNRIQWPSEGMSRTNKIMNEWLTVKQNKWGANEWTNRQTIEQSTEQTNKRMKGNKWTLLYM